MTSPISLLSRGKTITLMVRYLLFRYLDKRQINIYATSKNSKNFFILHFPLAERKNIAINNKRDTEGSTFWVKKSFY